MFGNRKKYIEQNNYFTKKDCPFCKTSEDEKSRENIFRIKNK